MNREVSFFRDEVTLYTLYVCQSVCNLTNKAFYVTKILSFRLRLSSQFKVSGMILQVRNLQVSIYLSMAKCPHF